MEVLNSSARLDSSDQSKPRSRARMDNFHNGNSRAILSIQEAFSECPFYINLEMILDSVDVKFEYHSLVNVMNWIIILFFCTYQFMIALKMVSK